MGFQKDILNLVYICESEGLHEVAKYWQMVVDMNEHQKTAFTSKIISSLFNTVTNKKIAVFGFAFKKEDAMAEFKYHNMEIDEEKLIFCSTPREAVESAHAIAVLTEWDEFKQYPYSEFYSAMMKPAFLFDGRGILNHRELEEVGFEVHAIGKGRGADGRLRILSESLECGECLCQSASPLSVHRSSWALYSSHGWTKQRIRIAFVLLDVCWCWKVVLHASPSPAWGLQRPSCFEHADYDQDVSII